MGKALTHWSGGSRYFACDTTPNPTDWHNVGPLVDCPSCLKLMAKHTIQETSPSSEKGPESAVPRLKAETGAVEHPVLNGEVRGSSPRGTTTSHAQHVSTEDAAAKYEATHIGESPYWAFIAGAAFIVNGPQTTQSAVQTGVPQGRKPEDETRGLEPSAPTSTAKSGGQKEYGPGSACEPCPQEHWCGAKGTRHCVHVHFAPKDCPSSVTAKVSEDICTIIANVGCPDHNEDTCTRCVIQAVRESLSRTQPVTETKEK